ncbi:hypothetical protein BGY98DRAFT_1005542, partial [Russula aff. rugulosa BPL654]
KRWQLKFGEAPTHLIFDDDGVAHEAIEMKAVEEIFGAGDAKRVALEAGRTSGEKERLMKMNGATLAEVDAEGDGYVTPEF